jgi:hypothetical protein
MTVDVDVTVGVDATAIVIVDIVKSASQLSQKMMYCFQSVDY